MIIGVTGTIGAGKGTFVEYLVSKYGFKHYSARDFIVEEIGRRELPIDRDSMAVVANDLRKINGASYIIEALYAKALSGGGHAIIESVREPAGVQFLKDQGAILIAIDADRPVRYERISARSTDTDSVSYEDFVAQEEREMTPRGEHTQSLLAVIESADYLLLNNGTEEEFQEKIQKVMQPLLR